MGLAVALTMGAKDATGQLPEEVGPQTAGATESWSAPAAPGGCFLPIVMGDVWGRLTAEPNPENDIDALDALFILRKIEGFFLWGGPACSSMDIDCDFDIDAVDALWILRWIAGLPYQQEENCIPIGTPYGAYSAEPIPPASGTLVYSSFDGRVLEKTVPAAPGCFLPYIFGNVWDDREVNAKDALWLLRKIGGFLLPGGGNPCAPMDVDCDGDSDAVDALTLLRWIAALPVYQQDDCTEIGTEFGPYS